MPKWEPRFDKVIGIEEFVFRHAKATTGATWLMQSDENVAMAVYLRNVANGQEMTVDVTSPGAKEAFERGRALAEVKIGALNFSCRDCHDPARGGLKWIRGQWLAEPKGQLDHLPTLRTSLHPISDIRHSRPKNGVAPLAYDPGLTDFSDKIMRKGKNSMSLCFEIGPP